MGSSAKKKKEKKKDFQKAKLKVGKTKPKAANATDTSFKAKGMLLLVHRNANWEAASTSQHNTLHLFP